MSVPGSYNIAAYKGDTLQVTFTLVDANNNPINLSTAAVKMQVRSASALLLTFTEGSGLTVSGAGNNVITLSSLITIANGGYSYDIEATFASGVVRTYVAGAFTVVSDITT